MTELLLETEEYYHSQSGENLSSHLLLAFAECPLIYRLTATGEYSRPDKEYFVVGRAAHCIVLEGMEEYEARYTSEFPINPSTGKPYGDTSQKYSDWHQMQILDGLQPISVKNDVLARKVARSTLQHKLAVELLNLAPHRESVIRMEYMGLSCQIRMDAMGEAVGIVDYKTCDSLDRFQYAAHDYNYYRQLAFYRTILKASRLVSSVIPVHIVATEKKWPIRTGVWELGMDELEQATEYNNEDIVRLKECQAANTWPTNYETKRNLKW